MQNFLKAKERGIDVQLFVRKNKDEKISKEFYYLGRMISTGRIKEFKEELNTEVEVEGLLDTVEYDYPKLHLSMDCFICKIKSGDLVLKEHEAAK